MEHLAAADVLAPKLLDVGSCRHTFERFSEEFYPFRLPYVYFVRKKQTVATDLRRFTYTDWNQNMGASNGHFTVSAA